MSSFTPTNSSKPCQACGDTTGKCRTTDSEIILCLNCTDEHSTPKNWKFLGTTDGGYFAGKLAPIDNHSDGLTDLERRVKWNALKAEREAKQAIQDKARISKLPTLVKRDQILSSKPKTLTATQNADLMRRGLSQVELDFCLSRGWLWQEIEGYGIAAIDPVTGLIVGGQKSNDRRGQTWIDRDGKEHITPKYSWLLKGEAHLPETDANPLAVWKSPDFDVTKLAEIRLCEGFLKSLVSALKAWRSDKQIVYVGTAGSSFGEAALSRVLNALPMHDKDDYRLCPDAGSLLNPSVTNGYQTLAVLIPNLKVLWWGQLEKVSGCDIDEIPEDQKFTVLSWEQFIKLPGRELVESLETTESESEDQQSFESDRDRLSLLSQARFSSESEEFWLGSGRTSKVCAGLRGNIKNGWVATAVSVGQVLSALTPRGVMIVPPDEGTSPQCCPAWVCIEGEKSSGKSVIFSTMKPFLDGLSSLEYSRAKDLAAIRREIGKMQADTEVPEENKPVVNNSLLNVEPVVLLGDFTVSYLKTAMAAADYWPRFARENHLTIQIPSCATLIFCREAVQFFESLGAFNQRNIAAQSFLAGAWSGEVESTGRKSNSEFVKYGDVALGMVLACQPNQFSQIIAAESSRNAVDTGFGIRFDITTMENTDRNDLTFQPRDMNALTVEKIDLFPTLRQFQSCVGLIDRIVCDQEATEIYQHQLFPWLRSETTLGWLDGFKSKATANVLRLAWGFQCIEIFDAIDRGDRPSTKISGASMLKAIEKTKLSLASLRFHLANQENERTITAKLKESEQQSSLVKSKYGAILTDPQLTHDFVSRQRSQGVMNFRSLLQKINGKARKDLKDIGLDAAAILRSVWDGMEATASVPPITQVVAPTVLPDDEDDDTVYEYDKEGNLVEND